jgi:hypothetical protein
MIPGQLAELKNDATLRKRLAKKMAHACFRNTKELEEKHAAGKLTDDDMKALMTDVVDYSFDFLMELCSPHGAEIMDDLKRRDELPEWSDPVPMIRRHLHGGA